MAGDFFCFREIECIIKLKGGIILNPDNLDENIKKYSEALVEMGQTYGGEVPLERERGAEKAPKTDSEESSEKPTNDSPAEEEVAKPAKMDEEPPKSDDSEDIDTTPAVKEPSVTFPQGEATSSATFLARVFTAENAYPIEGAKIVVYRGDNIYAFLETDSEGKTKTVRLPAFKESNSLEEDSQYQSIDYSADAFAEGFKAQKGLLVSSVGGSDIVLNVLMIPEGEGLS